MSPPDIPVLCAELDGLQRQRKFYIKLRNQQANAAGALVRQVMRVPPKPEGDITAERIEKLKAVALKIVAGEEPEGWETVSRSVQGPMAALRMSVEPLENSRHTVELQMKRVVRKLPIADWADSIRGLGELAVGVLVAESGDLSNYSNEGKLWKRLGLAPFNGQAGSTWRRKGGLSAEEWTVMGYSPRRLAEIHSCVAAPLFRAQTGAKDESRPHGPYRLVYDARRARTAETHPEWSKAQSHMDGLRIMTKSLISDLWSEWRRADGLVSEKTSDVLPDAEPFREAAE